MTEENVKIGRITTKMAFGIDSKQRTKLYNKLVQIYTEMGWDKPEEIVYEGNFDEKKMYKILFLNKRKSGYKRRKLSKEVKRNGKI